MAAVKGPLKISPYVWVLGLVLILLLLDFFRIVDFREHDAYDSRMRLRGPRPAYSDILIVEIDDHSLQEMGVWPWPRNIYAEFTRRISQYEPKIIFFDILFPEQSPNPRHDLAFSKAIEEAGNVSLLFHYHENPLQKKPIEFFFPISSLKDAARSIGYPNIDTDRDSIVRRISPWIDTDKGRFYHSSITLLRSVFKDPGVADEWVSKIPLDEKGKLLINYPGPETVFRRIPFNEAIYHNRDDPKRQEEIAKLFYNKYIMVGHAATATTDLLPTPFAALSKGIVIQASALHTLLSGHFLRKPPFWIHYLIVIILALAIAWTVQKTKAHIG